MFSSISKFFYPSDPVQTKPQDPKVSPSVVTQLANAALSKKKPTLNREIKSLKTLNETLRDDAYIPFSGLNLSLKRNPEKILLNANNKKQRMEEEHVHQENGQIINRTALQLRELQKLCEGRNESQILCLDFAEEIMAHPNESPETLLGRLLLVARFERSSLDTISRLDWKEKLAFLNKASFQIIVNARQKLANHTLLHKRVKLQRCDKSKFHKMSLLMADLLVHETGFLNFGLLEDLKKDFVPEEIKPLDASENLNLVLEEIKINPTLWDIFSKINSPQSKDNPSDFLIRACFDKGPNDPITRREAQVVVLSAILGHFSQESSTCFVTAWIIKALYNYLPLVVKDLGETIEKGYISRVVEEENRKFPFQLKPANHHLDTLIHVDSQSRIISVKKYKRQITKIVSASENIYLYESPGIQAVCQAMGIIDIVEAVKFTLLHLPDKFLIKSFIEELGAYALSLQGGNSYQLRSKADPSLKSLLIEQGKYAFVSQEYHPLHGTYEQILASMIDHFGSKLVMASWIFNRIEKSLKLSVQDLSNSHKRVFAKLIVEMFLPMITRMRFRYNPFFDDVKNLFDDGNEGVSAIDQDGFELCDGGLPNDFQYSSDLYYQFKRNVSEFKSISFKDYPPTSTWKSLNTQQKFQQFLKDVVEQTAVHLMKSLDRESQICLKEVINNISGCIFKKDFIDSVIKEFLGHDRSEWDTYLENEEKVDAKPWIFKWGGEYEAFLKVYFGINGLAKEKCFQGNQREVLAKCINFVKDQPNEMKTYLGNPRCQIVVSNPIHYFLLKPSHESFLKAWSSPMDAVQYIEQHVEAPGLEVAHMPILESQKLEMIDYISQNKWYLRCNENDDFDRLQLSQYSQELFEGKLRAYGSFSQLSHFKFLNVLITLVAESRTGDPKVSERNEIWENNYKKVLKKKLISLHPHLVWKDKIKEETAKALLDYAKTRKDSIAFTAKGTEQLVRLMKNIEGDLSICQFRKILLANAYKVHCEELFEKDNRWLNLIAEYIDEMLFKVLPEEYQDKLINAGIVTHVSLWANGIHNNRFIFMVNPGTAELEFCSYVQDTRSVEFMHQDEWFDQDPENYSRSDFPLQYREWKNTSLYTTKGWMFPDNYRSWK